MLISFTRKRCLQAIYNIILIFVLGIYDCPYDHICALFLFWNEDAPLASKWLRMHSTLINLFLLKHKGDMQILEIKSYSGPTLR